MFQCWIECSNIETNTLDARRLNESTNFESDENITSLEVQSLYTKVPLKEAIDTAVRKLNKQKKPPALGKRPLKMAVSQVHFKINET